MVNTNLVKYVVATSFAPGSNTLIGSAVSRLAAAFVGAGIIGAFLAKALNKADLPAGVPYWLGLNIVAVLGFILAGFILLSVYSSKNNLGRNTSWKKITHLMPISSTTRWLIEIVPSTVVMGCLAVFSIQLLLSVCRQIDLSPIHGVIAFLFSLAAVHGLMSFAKIGTLLKGITFVILSGVCLWLVDLSLKVESASLADKLNILSIVLVILPIFGLVHNFVYGYSLVNKLGNDHIRQLIPGLVPEKFWLLVKLIRNSRTRNSFMLALGISLVMAVTTQMRRQSISDPQSLLLATGVLSASFSCELRGVMRRYMPPEMIQINGINAVVRAEVFFSMLSGLLISLPLTASLIGLAANKVQFALYAVALQSFSSLSGLLASTMFVPADGEIGSQFLATIIATSIMTLFLKYSNLADIHLVDQLSRIMAAVITLVTFIFLIEKLRRLNYGRTK